jgi:glycine/serine hydroxymethyltransferase
MCEAEMEHIGRLIGRVLTNLGDEPVAKQVSAEVLALTARFPVPGIAEPVRV